MDNLEKALSAARQAVFNDHFRADEACAALFRLLEALAEPDHAAETAEPVTPEA